MPSSSGFNRAAMQEILKNNPGVTWDVIRDIYNKMYDTNFTTAGLRGVAARSGVNKGKPHEHNQYKVSSEAAQEGVWKDEGASYLSIRVIGPRITCEEEAIAEAKVDMKRWKIKRLKTNWWPTTMKGDDGEPIQVINHQFDLTFEPKTLDTIEELRQAMKELSKPRHFSIGRSKKNRGNLCYVGMHDPHCGKYGYEAESGTDYDLNHFEVAYLGSIEDTIQRVSAFGPMKFVLPIGQDFFHIDNPANMTIAGTPQDVDTRLSKVTKTGLRVVIQGADMLAQVAPVELIYAPGNHDPTMSYMLALALECRYHGTRHIEVDTGPKARKYREHGVNLFGVTHGSEEKHAELALIMAGENKENGAWCRTREHTWFLGHFHHRKEMRYVAGQGIGPVMIRTLPSLSGTDAWHYRKGYVESPRATEAYIFNDMDGYVGHVSSNVRLPESATLAA